MALTVKEELISVVLIPMPSWNNPVAPETYWVVVIESVVLAPLAVTVARVSASADNGVNPNASVTLLELTPVIKSAISLLFTNAPVVEGSTGV